MATNVQVAIRCRPMAKYEKEKGSKPIVDIVQSGKGILLKKKGGENNNNNNTEDNKQFTFDYAFGDDSTQEQVYALLGKPIVEKALQGFNGTIFAYGQTGSGKSHTMMGNGDDIGIIPRLTSDLFLQITELEDEDNKFFVTVSYLEIYNEIIKDLLNPTSTANSRPKSLKIRQNVEQGTYVEGLCELVVKNNEDILSLIEQGNTVRKVAATKMNDTSSRSHSCFTLKLEKKISETTSDGVQRETSLSSKINLVDLAGSERASKTGATGQTLKEGANINQSLMTLGKVINGLAEASKNKNNSNNKAHIPYRESKLTRLLSDALGGNSLTLMMAAISPADYNVDETYSTLQYANRAKSIANEVVKNEDVHEKIIRELKEEIDALRAALGANGGNGGTLMNAQALLQLQEDASASPKMIGELESKLAELEASKMQTWEEKERLNAILEEERKKNMDAVMTSAIDSVKEDKLEKMKAIKRLQHEKQQLTKEQKQKKEKYTTLKKNTEKMMLGYQDLYDQFEKEEDAMEKEKIENNLIETLSNIEKNKGVLNDLKERLLDLKHLVENNDEELTAVKAALVANAGLLEENDKLRHAIAQEEKAKWDEAREEYLKAELEEEKEKLEHEKRTNKITLEEEIEYARHREKKYGNVREKLLQSRVVMLESDVEHYEQEIKMKNQLIYDLELRVATDEVNLEEEIVLDKSHEAKIVSLTDKLQALAMELDQEKAKREAIEKEIKLNQIYDNNKESISRGAELTIKSSESDITINGIDLGGLNDDDNNNNHNNNNNKRILKKHSTEGKTEEENYVMFKSMMEMFEEERRQMNEKLSNTKNLLRESMKDVNTISKANEKLQAKVKELKKEIKFNEVYLSPVISPVTTPTKMSRKIKFSSNFVDTEAHTSGLLTPHKPPPDGSSHTSTVHGSRRPST